MFLVLVLMRNPIVLVRAVLLDFAFGHPRWALGRYVRKWGSLYGEAIANLLQFEDISGKGLLSGWYTGAHNIARFELYRAGREYALEGNSGLYFWRKIFGPVSPGPNELSELAAVANKVTGRLPLAILGISESQEQLESALFFPRYLRCLIGLVTDALQGRVRGNEARRLLTHAGLTAVVLWLLVSI